ncbi:hypothetical protein MMC07_008797 [Pseudocyphellaria aurata]|nr:hypothetical protein [Pseudocyphellaria aurata]
MPDIIITNNSGHGQEFEVHGWNHNISITVRPHSTSRIHAADKTSGAIIALHDGHEGEQAEITFNGFGGNDFIDISNIVGAGGNITIQQEGDPSTRKGDPLFMQNFRSAWHKASSETKASLRSSVFLDGHGQVTRIGPIKDHPQLEKFVRSFADGKTYIGVGAWGGSPGVDSDNHQSSAGHGTKNAQITYSDGDATPSHPPHLAHRSGVQKLVEQTHVKAASLGTQAHENKEHSGPGVSVSNRSNKEQAYFFYDNYWNGNGTAGANFDHPLKSVRLAPHATSFVALPNTFKGRVQRGTRLPATWVEFQLNASNDHGAHGDISLEQGCDGAALIHATDGSGRVNGFSHDILHNAPRAALTKRADGMEVLASTMGNWMAGPNEAAAEYELKVVGQKKAYIKGGTGTDDVASKNQRLAVEFF